jgi:hypothetical protein
LAQDAFLLRCLLQLTVDFKHLATTPLKNTVMDTGTIPLSFRTSFVRNLKYSKTRFLPLVKITVVLSYYSIASQVVPPTHLQVTFARFNIEVS